MSKSNGSKMMLIRTMVILLLVLTPFAEGNAHEYKGGDLIIDHPWSRATHKGAKIGVGYLKIENRGKTPDKLISGESPIAEHFEIHQSKMDDGIMKMMRVSDGLEIPAGGTVELKTGSYHIMFTELKKPIVEDKSFKATLTFEKAGKVEVEFKVESMSALSSGESMGGSSSKGDHHMQMKHGAPSAQKKH